MGLQTMPRHSQSKRHNGAVGSCRKLSSLCRSGGGWVIWGRTRDANAYGENGKNRGNRENRENREKDSRDNIDNRVGLS